MSFLIILFTVYEDDLSTDEMFFVEVDYPKKVYP